MVNNNLWRFKNDFQRSTYWQSEIYNLCPAQYIKISLLCCLYPLILLFYFNYTHTIALELKPNHFGQIYMEIHSKLYRGKGYFMVY